MRKLFLTLLLSLFALTASAALTITPAAVTDWTAVAQNTVGESATVTVSDSYQSILHIQAFLDSTTAHTGTEFIVQISSNTSGDEDWQDFARFVELIGTANSEPIDDNPLTAGSTTITVTDTGGNYETAPFAHWIAIEDGTLINSELVLQTGYTLNASFTILDGTTNAHVVDVVMYDIAITKNILLPLGTARVRLVVNNTYDVDGSTLNYKVRITETTGL